MKSLFRRLTVLLIVAAVFSPEAFSQKFHIVAHRGFWKSEAAAGAENSLASLREAGDIYCWGSEFDVQLTRDGVAVVNHDPTIRSGEKKLRIDEYDWKQLRKLDLVNGEKRPTLDAYIAAGARIPDTRMVVELKVQREPAGGHAREDRLLSETVSILKKYGVFSPDRVVFISFSMYLCEQIAQKYPEFTNQYLKGDLPPAEVKSRGINGIDYQDKVFYKHPEWVAQAHDLGMSVNVWTVDREEDIRNMLDLGIEYITTNEPLRVRQLLNERGDYCIEASELTLVGKLHPQTGHIYNRVDTLVYGGFTRYENQLARESSGIAVAFKTDSRRITVQTKYEMRGNPLNATPIAYAGYDLYIKKDGNWLWAGSGVSSNSQPEKPKDIVKEMDGTMHECLLYLPLFSILDSVKICVEGGSEIVPMENPFRHRVAVFGSSFTHGASCSRPGMAYPAIFSRDTGIQLLSLGLSGNSKLQQSFARVIAGADIDALLVDAFSNPTVAEIEERLFPFIETVQAAHPDIPIIFQRTIYRESRNFNTANEKREQERIDRSVELVKEAQKRYKHIYLVYPDATSPEHETSVDGTHPGDYGYWLWARSIEKPVLRILAQYGIK